MRRILIPKIVDINQTSFHLDDFESDHLLKVLRLREDDIIECLDGHRSFFSGKIKNLGKGKVSILRDSPILTDPKRYALPLHLEMACIKGDAMDWVIEKSVEVGVKTLTPLFTDHSVVKLSSKSPDDFRIRWQKIADQSLKQCGRLEKMEIQTPVRLEEHFQNLSGKELHRIWAFEKEESQSLESVLKTLHKNSNSLEPITLLIGPEGGFSQKEIHFLAQMKSTAVTLSPWILRAETAAMLGSSLIASSMREWER